MNTFLDASAINKLFNFKQLNNNKKQAFIKVNEVELPNNSENNKIVAYLGSRKAFNNGTITYANPYTKIWNFVYTDKNHSSFVLALYKESKDSQVQEKNELLGEIEIKLSSFKTNSVTKHSFILRSFDRNSLPIIVNLSIHLDEDGSKQFKAPESNILNYEYEIISNKFYSETTFEEELI